LASRASDERPFRSPAASSIAATGDKRAISVLTFVSETEIYYFRGLLVLLSHKIRDRVFCIADNRKM
jgi:hypothetical protein